MNYDNKYEEADDGVTAHNEVAERPNYLARISAGKYASRRGNVQRQSQNRCDKQHRRKHRELQRLFDEHCHDKDNQ